MLRVAQVLVVVNAALIGILLLQGGDDAPDGLHIFYGVFPVVVNVVAEGLRVNAAAFEIEGVEDVESLDRTASRSCWRAASCCARSGS